MEKPENIASMTDVLENLATFGAALIPVRYRPWLTAIGVVHEESIDGWSIPTPFWIDDTLPCQNPKDLLRKTVLRDCRYRAHLDISMATVLHAIGVSERWQRLEELIFEAFLPFMPRFVQLMEWQQKVTGKKLKQISETDWLKADESTTRGCVTLFVQWDEILWGESKTLSSKFPLLTDLYLPLIHYPIGINSRTHQFPEKSGGLLYQLVNAATQKDGLIVSNDFKEHAEYLANNGIPIRTSFYSDQFIMAWLVGRVTISENKWVDSEGFEAIQVPFGITDRTSKSMIVKSKDMSGAVANLWDVIDSGTKLYSFLSIKDRASQWPDEISKRNPPWAKIPDKSSLMSVGKPRSLTPNIDGELRNLCGHRLYGALIQLFLLEALDRELGEETLTLAPPLHHRTDRIEEETHVLYQPRSKPGIDRMLQQLQSFDLGLIDTTLSALAQYLGIYRICHPYEDEISGPWSHALKLLRDSGVVTGYHDRWTLSSPVLDRLHGGGLMTSVIRRGRQYRDNIHDALYTMWKIKQKKTDWEPHIEPDNNNFSNQADLVV
jgi:hypothetical protein